MLAAVLLSAACLASAAEDGAPLSLRGGRSLSDAAENTTLQESRTLPEDTDFRWAASSVEKGDPPVGVSDAPRLNGTILQGNFSENASEPSLVLSSSFGGWHTGGDKLWGRGRGVESINSLNVGYYNRGMYAARSHCGGAGCALIVNPPGHRTVHVFHIHFARYAGYGASLKRRLESKVCRRGGWHGGGLPCHGKAAFFAGFPGVFSKARTGGGIRSASVIAWPASCGGRGTIIQLAYGCSIEHQIRGDFNPRYR